MGPFFDGSTELDLQNTQTGAPGSADARVMCRDTTKTQTVVDIQESERHP